jgi:cardiolipin synthase
VEGVAGVHDLRYNPRVPRPSTTSFRWLRSGQEVFPVMLAAIEAARHTIRLEMYIYSSDPPGDAFRDALVRAAIRGVQVRVLLDAVGSIGLSASFWKPLTEAGGKFRWFNPLKFGRMSFRDHRKMLVCDELTAFVGGFNIAPEYTGDGVTKGWCDLGIGIQGPLGSELAESFDAMFGRASFEHKPLHRFRKSTARTTISAETWRLLLSGPGRGYNFLKRTFATDLANAHTVQIICAYFLPTWRLRRELERVVRRGGRVQLILAGKSDVRLSQLASQKLYRQLLKRGLEIYEYQPQVLHAKLFIVDEQVYVGSSNLDARSLNINYELLVRIGEQQVVDEAREIFRNALAHSRRVELKEWRRSRTFWTKLMEQWAYFLLARVDPWWARGRAKHLR